MLAFDWQMKQLGFTGNQAQIILSVEGSISASELNDRIQSLKTVYPILTSVIKRSLLHWIPCWAFDNGRNHSSPPVKRHFSEDEDEITRIKRDILNRRLAIEQGELFRFDLIYSGKSSVEVIMSWSHMLMDVHGAEYFLAMIGRTVAVESGSGQRELMAGGYTGLIPSGSKWRQAQKSFQRVDKLAEKPPVSMFTKVRYSPAPRFDYQVISFTPGQTADILAQAEKCSGFMNETAYFNAAALGQFHRLMQSKNISAPGYVVPVSIDLRKKGTRLPVFSNQSASLLYGFEPEDLQEFDRILTAFSKQTQEAVRDDMINSDISLMEFCRIFPSGFYARKIRQAFKGEIASLVLANPGKTFDQLEFFMGQPVRYQHHVPTIVVPPGMGIVFYTCMKQLFITLVYVEELITPDEARGFLDAVGHHLMSGRLI